MGNLILLQCLARTICTDLHCRYDKYQGQFVLFLFGFLKKTVLSHAVLPSEGSRLDDPNQNTHPPMSAHHEDPCKTANRSWKEQ